MHIELLAGDCEVKSRTFEREGKTNSVHEQRAYLHQPGLPYPLPFSISLRSAADAYGPGTYVFHPDSIRTNAYGALEFNRFGMRLVKANIAQDSKPRAVNA